MKEELVTQQGKRKVQVIKLYEMVVHQTILRETNKYNEVLKQISDVKK